jgi:hypothetical protein
MVQTDKFVETVIQQFRKVKPEWASPHDTIFTVAQTMKMTAKVNGITAEAWKKMQQSGEDDDVDEDKLDVLLTAGKEKATVKLLCPDFRVLEVRD